MWQVNLKKCLKIFDKVYVSSDSQFILDQAEELGAIGILRSERLCGDTPNITVYQSMYELERVDAFVAVQANSPNIDCNTIAFVKKLLKLGVDEVMTCHEDYSIYGSVWAMTSEKLKYYADPYKPTPSILVKDLSEDIHTQEDYQQALQNYGK